MSITEGSGRRTWAVAAALSGAIAVAAGAFAAHGLKARSPEAAELFETAAHYQITHALAMLAALALFRTAKGTVAAALAAFLTGALLFSGSLYAYALTDWPPLVFVTPVGGTAFLIGWGALALAAWRRAE